MTQAVSNNKKSQLDRKQQTFRPTWQFELDTNKYTINFKKTLVIFERIGHFKSSETVTKERRICDIFLTFYWHSLSFQMWELVSEIVSELSDGVFIEAGENEEITGQPLKQHR